MNIDQLKTAWQHQPQHSFTNDRWMQMLQQSSSNPLTKLRSRTKFESIFACVINIGLAIAFYWYEHLPEASLAYLALGVYSYWYSRKQMQLLNKIESPTGDLKLTVHNHVHSLEMFFINNIWFSTFLVPPLMLLLGWLGYRKTGELPISDFPTAMPDALWAYGGFIAGLCIMFHFIMRVSVKMKYGKYMKELKDKAAQFE